MCDVFTMTAMCVMNIIVFILIFQQCVMTTIKISIGARLRCHTAQSSCLLSWVDAGIQTIPVTHPTNNFFDIYDVIIVRAVIIGMYTRVVMKATSRCYKCFVLFCILFFICFSQFM